MTKYVNINNAVLTAAEVKQQNPNIAWDFNRVPPQEVLDNLALSMYVAPQPSTDQIKAQKWEEIKAERDFRKFNGVFAEGFWFHSDTYSRTQWLALTMLGASVPAVQWTTMTGAQVALTPALVQAVFQATVTLDANVFGVAASHRTAMEASQDPGAYDFSTGWPDTFVG